MVRDAVRGTGVLAGRNFGAFATGSYRNNTNIRLDSDIDVALVCTDAFFYDVPPGFAPTVFGLGTPATYGLDEFRDDVGRALAKKFGPDVKPGNKTFDIAGNSYRLPADATPFLEYRQYSGQRRPDGSWAYVAGIATRARAEPGKLIVNWPQHHYDNGVAKNTATGRRFKRVARILKRLRNDMMDHGDASARAAATPMASFLLECIAYNAADSCYKRADGTYYDDVQAVILAMWRSTKEDALAASLVEVNGRKTLFGPHQGWSRAQAHAFLAAAWNHVGFKE
jgi:hypothetical protein